MFALGEELVRWYCQVKRNELDLVEQRYGGVLEQAKELVARQHGPDAWDKRDAAQVERSKEAARLEAWRHVYAEYI